MNWEELLNKSVKVVQRDGWVKHGLFLGCEGGFVRLRFDDGRTSTIAIDNVAVLEERPGGRAT